MYEDGSTAFGGNNFLEFRDLCEFRHEQIHVVWEVNMNESEEVLAYSVGDMWIPTYHDEKLVTRAVWASLVAKVKAECSCKCLLPFLFTWTYGFRRNYVVMISEVPCDCLCML
jgi:hypothetical protein